MYKEQESHGADLILSNRMASPQPENHFPKPHCQHKVNYRLRSRCDHFLASKCRSVWYGCKADVSMWFRGVALSLGLLLPS